jgi:hypothetical protein
MYWRRWFVEWLVLLLWLGLLPIVASAIYYAVKIAPDFDSALESRSPSAVSSTSDLVWAVRVGGASEYKSGLVLHATRFGVNAEDKNSAQRAHRVWDGELFGTYQATYIARYRGTPLPTVVCVFRDVTPDGKNSYEVQAHGSRPIGIYTLYIVLLSAGSLVFLKVAKVVAKRNKATAERRDR